MKHMGTVIFVDIAIPLLDFMVVTGWNPGAPLGVAFSTSALHLTDNEDRPDYPGWDVPTVPAPDSPVPASLGIVSTERLYARTTL
jgi:hypothetical protein